MAFSETPREGAKTARRAVCRHEADARHGDIAARERDDPREPARSQDPVEIDLHVLHARERHLELRALQVGPRNPQAELTVEAIMRAAGQHANAAAHLMVAIADRHAGGDPAIHLERGDPGAGCDRRAGRGRTLGEPPIETAAVDNGCGDVAALDA